MYFRQKDLTISGRSLRCLVAAAAAVALLAAACGGGESSGLPTLVDTATTAATDPEDIESVSEPMAVTEPTSEAAGTAELPSPAEAAAADIEADQTVGAVAAADPEAITDEEPAESDAAGKEPAEAGMAGEKPAEPGETTGEEPIRREDLTDEERLLAFAECMRKNGVDFPDPVVEADGTVTFGSRPGSGGGGPAALLEIGRDPDLPAARDTCQGLVESLAFGPGQGGSDLVEVQDALLEFAQCMRDNGIDIGDPDMSAFAPGANNDDGPVGPFGSTVMEIEIGDADFAAVFEVCQQQLPEGGLGVRSGGGG